MEFNMKEGDDAFITTTLADITSQVLGEEIRSATLDKGKKVAAEEGASKQVEANTRSKFNVVEDTFEFDGVKEVEYESEDLASLQGSNDEVDPYPTFNEKVDFSRDIKLALGLKFKNIEVFKRALIQHAVKNHYDFYLLHNGSKRVTIYCRHRCNCEWNLKHGRFRKCRCNFKVMAAKLMMQDEFQIKSMRLKHDCGWHDTSSKLSSIFLSEKYIDHWRIAPSYKLTDFITLVEKDYGTKIKYTKAWLTRERENLMIFGDVIEEYAKVYDYDAALKAYNLGSSLFVQCEGIESGEPTFKRIYGWLAALKDGLRRGCRPLLGVDGCHLKGTYPEMILTAVAKDGNNDIYTLAWKVVETENKDSWTWFLDALADDIGFPSGEGLTLMSDGQKGLLDAIATTMPKAVVLFCVRHIWDNFKLHFS